MKKILILCIGLSLLSCSQKSVELDHLGGYWEISKAENADGKAKKYTLNQSIDYIFLEDNKGFRKKLKPQLSGTFQGSNNVEKFEIKEEDGQYSLVYSTPFDTWEEEIVELTEESLVVRSQFNVTYTYTRYEGLVEWDEDEK